MQRALAGHGDRPFDVPDNISFVDIDRDTGAAAAPGCLRVFSESFLSGIRTGGSCAKSIGSRFRVLGSRFHVPLCHVLCPIINPTCPRRFSRR